MKAEVTNHIVKSTGAKSYFLAVGDGQSAYCHVNRHGKVTGCTFVKGCDEYNAVLKAVIHYKKAYKL